MSDQPQTAALIDGLFGYALASMTGLLAANGGTLIALLSFLGTIWQKQPADAHILVHKWQWAIMSLVLGVTLAVGTAMISYISQTVYLLAAQPNQSVWGPRLRNIAIGLATTSLILFITGISWAGLVLDFYL